MTEVNFSDQIIPPDNILAYSVIVARCHNEWIFVRHCNRNTWEIPGGHIEPDEKPWEAALRELIEETGAIDPEPEAVSTYSVTKEGITGYGWLYFAEVSCLGQVQDTSEICEVKIMKRLPENLTYPDIQPILFEKVVAWLKSRGRF